MHVETKLVVLHIDFQNGTNRCLLTDDDSLPSAAVSDFQSPVDCGPVILEEYLEIKPDWVTFVLLDVGTNEDNILSVYYACMIPEVIKNLKGQWVEIGRIEDGETQRMAFDACQKILARF